MFNKLTQTKIRNDTVVLFMSVFGNDLYRLFLLRFNMTESANAFERMVSSLVDNYGMSTEGAEKLIVRSSEAVYTTREQSKYKALYEKLIESKTSEEAAVEACKTIVNSSPTWEMTAEDAHRYQLTGSFVE